MSASKLFGKDILITSTTNASGSTVGSISTLGGINVNQTMLVLGALTSTADSNTIGNIFTTGGNVGFGTTSPVQRLDVNGNLNITGNFYQNGSVYSGSTQWGSTGANIYFNTGNVGIGSTAPRSNLTLASSVSAAAQSTVSNASIFSAYGPGGGGTGLNLDLSTYVPTLGTLPTTRINLTDDANFSSNINVLTKQPGTVGNALISRLYIVSTTGNIGINTTNPGTRLDINGAANLTSGSLRITSIGSTTASGVQATGSIHITNPISLSHLYYGITGTGVDSVSGVGSNNPQVGMLFSGNASQGTYIHLLTSNAYVNGAQQRLTIRPDGNVGIGTTNPTNTLQVNGSITHGGGYAVFGLSVGTYANGSSQMSFGNTQFSSRITNNGNYFVFQDAGIFMIHVKLNSDTSVTSNLTLTCSYWNGSSWVGYQNSEESRTFNNQTDYSTHFMVQASANQSWAIFINNPSGANWSFSTTTGGDYWSRLMVYKVA